jgi:hypothetical protein
MRVFAGVNLTGGIVVRRVSQIRRSQIVRAVGVADSPALVPVP